MRFFNTTGPCNPTDHYMLPATARLDVLDIDRLLRQKAYFVLHAPRQTGKTTAMLELARELTASGEYIKVFAFNYQKNCIQRYGKLRLPKGSEFPIFS